MRYVLQNKDLTILFLSTFLFFTNEALFLPTLPLHLSAIGYSHTKIGVVLGAFALGVLLSRPLSGYITDEKGRKISLVIGVAVFFLAPIFYLLSKNFFYLILIRFFHGLGISFYTTSFPAYITDTCDEHRRGETLGHMATSTTLAFTLGPLMGMSIYSAYGFNYLVFSCTATAFINLMVILQLSEPIKKSQKQAIIPYKTVVFKRSVLVSSFIQFVNALIFGGVMTFLPLLLKEIDGLNIGIFFLVESTLIILLRLMAAKLPDKYGRGPVFFYSFLIILCAVFLVSKINSLELLIAAAAFFGIGSSLCSPALSAYIADNSDPMARGTVFGFFYGAFDVGVLTAGLLLGAVADWAGIREMFMLTAMGGTICLFLFSLFIKKGYRQSLRWALLPQR